MPRTKAQRKNPENCNALSVVDGDEEYKTIFKSAIEDERQRQQEALRVKFQEIRGNIHLGTLNKTLADLAKVGEISSILSVTSQLDKTTTKNNRTISVSKPRAKRSRSCQDEDRAQTKNTRQSRSKTIKSAKNRISRSVSNTRKENDKYFTPLHQQPPPNHSGTITPKVKSNTPIWCMRRPKVGEIAWSNQGSPLMVSGGGGPDRSANINIPIGDQILSVLPTSTILRQSQIPEIPEETKKQLEILRDNLMKMCEKR
ncbi:hypothetical protein ABEB36_003711 [Hypothenemus hampei]|uniref:Borealin C-terminal domain-containing protein n=1 Tax=Hypothenemus hampei TaxID=57062 RepID=A0ABD1F0Y1_HYPHA